MHPALDPFGRYVVYETWSALHAPRHSTPRTTIVLHDYAAGADRWIAHWNPNRDSERVTYAYPVLSSAGDVVCEVDAGDLLELGFERTGLFAWNSSTGEFRGLALPGKDGVHWPDVSGHPVISSPSRVVFAAGVDPELPSSTVHDALYSWQL